MHTQCNNQTAVNVCTVGMVACKRTVVDTISRKRKMPLSYCTCWGFFFVFCFVFFERRHIRAWKSMLMYLFIYLFGWPSSSKLPLAAARGFYCRVLFCFFFFPPDLGTFFGGWGAAMLAGVKGLCWDSCCSSFCGGGPLPAYWSGSGLCLGRGIAGCT